MNINLGSRLPGWRVNQSEVLVFLLAIKVKLIWTLQGTRGGAGNFSWNAVKEDKHREYYLGHSVKAAAGRWQKNKVGL